MTARGTDGGPLDLPPRFDVDLGGRALDVDDDARDHVLHKGLGTHKVLWLTPGLLFYPMTDET